jgi:SnoaL-like domain
MSLLEAIDRQDRDTLADMLADDVVFHSPVQTYRGRERVILLLLTIGGILEHIEPTRQVDGISFFQATVEEHPMDGVLVEHADSGGRVSELTLMARPLAQLQAAVARMARALAERAELH